LSPRSNNGLPSWKARHRLWVDGRNFITLHCWSDGVPNGFLFRLLMDREKTDIVAFLKLL